MRVFDPDALSVLLREFRLSMRRLLFDLCDDLEAHYRPSLEALRLPLTYFRLVGDTLKPEEFSHWKVVGWIEELNDLVYFIDLRDQLVHERRPRGFAEQLFEECEEKFYENSYREELFPAGVPASDGLKRRLHSLCMRLALQVTQESLFLVPGLPCLWLAQDRARTWTVPCELGPNFERAELPGRVYLGLEGGYLDLPSDVRQMLARHGGQARFLFTPGAIRLRVGTGVVSLLSRSGGERWHWRCVLPSYLRPPSPNFPNGLTLGPSLVYRRDLTPLRIVPAPAALAERIQAAVSMIEQAWPEGARLFGLLTSRIIPLDASGVVSFSYRHRPGLSFINMFERDQLDLIDDLVHENSHHHLNLLLCKYEMRRGDRNQEVFYSPWRRSLRPLHGILHATFTFTMGALLFGRLARAKELPAPHRLRARFRCLEEVESVGYSIRDLSYAADRLGWLHSNGAALVQTLKREISKVGRQIASYRSAVLRSRYGPALRRHIRTLKRARATYGRISASGLDQRARKRREQESHLKG
jgi:HEXXH motif-containing protein